MNHKSPQSQSCCSGVQKTGFYWLFVGGLVLLLGAGLVLLRPGTNPEPETGAPARSSGELAAPLSAAVPPRSGPSVATSPASAQADPLPEDWSPAARATAEKLASQPWLTSEAFEAPPFNAENYAKDPQSYLSAVVPGRAQQEAAADSGAPFIAIVGPDVQDCPAGGTVELAVRVPANAPVTFHCYHYGAFQNGAPTITVAADETGLARARWTAIPGATDGVELVASSPLCRGLAGFTLHVLPKPDSDPVVESVPPKDNP